MTETRTLKDYRPQHDEDCGTRQCQKCMGHESSSAHGRLILDLNHEFIGFDCTCGLDALLAQPPAPVTPPRIDVQGIAEVAWRCIRQCGDYEGPPVMCPAHQEEAKALALPASEARPTTRADFPCGATIDKTPGVPVMCLQPYGHGGCHVTDDGDAMWKDAPIATLLEEFARSGHCTESGCDCITSRVYLALAAQAQEIEAVYQLGRGPIEQAKTIPLVQWVKTRFVHVEDYNAQAQEIETLKAHKEWLNKRGIFLEESLEAAEARLRETPE